MKIGRPISAAYGAATNAAVFVENVFDVGNEGLYVIASDLRLEKQKSLQKEELYKTDGFVAYQRISAKSELIRNELESIKDSDLDAETKQLLETELLNAFKTEKK